MRRAERPAAPPVIVVTDMNASYERPAGDPVADWWTMDDIAAWLDVKYPTVRRYRARPRDKGGLPPEDRMFGRTPAWRPSTIIRWHREERRGQGARTDLD